MYCLARKGSVRETADSFTARAVYRNRRFITVVVRNFYHAARRIPYPLLTRGDGVGGFSEEFFFTGKNRSGRISMISSCNPPASTLTSSCCGEKRGLYLEIGKTLIWM